MYPESCKFSGVYPKKAVLAQNGRSTTVLLKLPIIAPLRAGNLGQQLSYFGEKDSAWGGFWRAEARRTG